MPELNPLERLRLIRRFLHYYGQAQTLYQVHSPFVYRFCEDILEDDKWYYAFEELEQLRQALLQSKEHITVTDFGAGSHVHNGKERKVADIARSAVSPALQSRVLFRLVEQRQPRTMLEFGTSLGLTAAYQAKAQPQARFISLEGCPSISALARNHLSDLGIPNVEVRTGEFGHTLEAALSDLGRLDYAFLDGNHQEQATLDYFEKCLPFVHEGTVLVLDDIHWSGGMERAWEQIRKHPRVSLSLDVFFMGLLFFRKENPQQEHHYLIPSAYKPWQKYLPG